MNNTPFFIENEKEVNKQVCKWMFGAAIIIWFMLVLNYLVLRYMARRFRTYIIKQRELIDELIRKDTHMNIAMKNSNDIIFEYDMLNDDYGKLELVVGRLCDITSEKEREERERIARQRDALTGLYSFERVRQIAIELEEQEINRIKYYFGYHTGKAWFEKLFEIALKYAKAQRADDLENNEKVQEKDKEHEVADIYLEDESFDAEKVSDESEFKQDERLVKNIEKLFVESKDLRSSLQIALARAGLFYHLNRVSVYEFEDDKNNAHLSYFKDDTYSCNECECLCRRR